jgi:U3 small nucleolar RNA-associated protein 7
MTHLSPSSPIESLSFCPFDDVLGVGHSSGFTSLLVPGAGEPNYDTLEADPYENKNMRREREVAMLMDKLQPTLINQDPDFVGKLAPEKEKKAEEEAVGAKRKRETASWAKMSRRERLSRTGEAEERPSDDEADEGVARPVKLIESTKKVRGKNKVVKKLRRRQQHIIDAKTVRPFLFSVLCM